MTDECDLCGEPTDGAEGEFCAECERWGTGVAKTLNGLFAGGGRR